MKQKIQQKLHARRRRRKNSRKASDPFAARVYKITRDPKGNRLTHMKITGGALKVKDIIDGEKAEQIRVYSGEKFYTEDIAEKGSICAVAGLTKTYCRTGAWSRNRRAGISHRACNDVQPAARRR